MEEITITEVQDASVIYNQDKAFIDVQIATAKTYPRNLKRAVDNSIAIVTMDQETASTCTYSLPRGGKPITGPTVHLAKVLAQQWGNLRCEAKVVEIGQKQITSQAVAFDLENNLAIKVNEAIDVVSKNTEFSQNELKLAIDKSKEKIEKPQQKTKRRGGKYKRRKTIKSK